MVTAIGVLLACTLGAVIGAGAAVLIIGHKVISAIEEMARRR
jgi:glycopeptide antibiotics resistance protein